MTPTLRRSLPRRRRRGAAALRWTLVLGVLASAGGAWALLARTDEVGYDGPTTAVARGPLRISVSEAGTIEAREKVVLKCEVDERSTTITYIIEEGTLVEEGQLLVQLDASVLQDELYDEEIDVLDTEADYLAAKENLEVVKNQAEADLKAAELALRFAREDVVKYREGEYPRQLMEATNNVTLAEETLTQAKEQLDWSQKLFERGFLSGVELDKDRLAFQSASLEVDLARTDVELLQEFTYGRQLAQLESDVEQAELALQRVRRATKADIAQAETNLLTRERQLTRQQAQLADIQRQVANCEIRSPVAGMAVYATTGRGDFRGNEEPLTVGREVRAQEELIHIPVADSKSVRIKVHESALDKIDVGQPVAITVDALPGRTFDGRVARISPLPDAQTQWLNPDLKVYDTEVHVVGDLTGLRTGMTCRAEILVEDYADALYVPIHCIVRIGDQPTAFVVEGAGLVARPVEAGLSNNRMIRILSGLSEGELVALAPPLDETDADERTPADDRPSDGLPADPADDGQLSTSRPAAESDPREAQPGGPPAPSAPQPSASSDP